jgi:hypothetical protein
MRRFSSGSLSKTSGHRRLNARLADIGFICGIGRSVVPSASGALFLKLHCLFAYNAAQETYQRAFIVVQMMSPCHSHRLIFPSVPIERTFARIIALKAKGK